MITAKELNKIKKENADRLHKSRLSNMENSIDYMLKYNERFNVYPRDLNLFKELIPKYEGITFQLKHVVPNWFNRTFHNYIEHYKVTYEIEEEK